MKHLQIGFLLGVLAYAMLGGAETDKGSAGATDLRVLNYRLELKIDFPKEILYGNCHMTLINQSAVAVERIPFLLYRLLKVIHVSDGQGNDLGFKQSVVSFEDWPQMQVNSIIVEPKAALEPGSKSLFSIQYEGYLLGYQETGMEYVKDSINKTFTIIRPDCRAYPTIGYPSSQAERAAGLGSFDYQLLVSVPDDLTVANGGEMTDRKVVDGWVTFTFCNLKPAWRIDAAIAAYRMIVDKGAHLKVYHFAEDTKGAASLLEATKKAVALYSAWFGPLADTSEFSIIEIPSGYGSQADKTCLLQTEDAFKRKEQFYQLYHEISHRWNVTARDPFPSRFESEGLATFLQYLTQEKLDNQLDALANGFERCCAAFSQECRDHSGWSAIPMIEYGKVGITDLSYTKGMVFFHVLHQLAGGNKFNDLIGSFYRRYRLLGATTEDFLQWVRKKIKMNADLFFTEWVYGVVSSSFIIEKKPFAEIVKRYRI